MDSGFQRHISELVARERSGHTAVVEGSLLYVWGGYMVRNTNDIEADLSPMFKFCNKYYSLYIQIQLKYLLMQRERSLYANHIVMKNVIPSNSVIQ